MPEGPLGFTRVLGNEKAELAITIPTDKNITEATVEAANGFFISSERQPFFDVSSVSTDNIFPDIEEDHIVIFTEDRVELQDIKLLQNNLRTEFDVDTFPSDITLSPTSSTDRPFTKSSAMPSLLFGIESNRGTQQEFRDAVQEVIAGKFDNISQPQFIDGENIAYITAQATVPLSVVDDWAKDILGPRNKKVTDIEISAILQE